MTCFAADIQQFYFSDYVGAYVNFRCMSIIFKYKVPINTINTTEFKTSVGFGKNLNRKA